MRICPSCNQLEEYDHDQKECEIDRLRAEVKELEAQHERDYPEDGECFLCKEATSCWAGNPGVWPIRLPFPGGNGETRIYHMQCVVKTLAEVERLRGEREEEAIQWCRCGAGFVARRIGHARFEWQYKDEAEAEARRRLAEKAVPKRLEDKT